jgi:hypothetical protein
MIHRIGEGGEGGSRFQDVEGYGKLSKTADDLAWKKAAMADDSTGLGRRPNQHSTRIRVYDILTIEPQRLRSVHYDDYYCSPHSIQPTTPSQS